MHIEKTWKKKSRVINIYWMWKAFVRVHDVLVICEVLVWLLFFSVLLLFRINCVYYSNMVHVSIFAQPIYLSGKFNFERFVGWLDFTYWLTHTRTRTNTMWWSRKNEAHIYLWFFLLTFQNWTHTHTETWMRIEFRSNEGHRQQFRVDFIKEVMKKMESSVRGGEGPERDL